MKKARVIIKTVTKHQVYVEQDGERFLYTLTSDLEEAKKPVFHGRGTCDRGHLPHIVLKTGTSGGVFWFFGSWESPTRRILCTD